MQWFCDRTNRWCVCREEFELALGFLDPAFVSFLVDGYRNDQLTITHHLPTSFGVAAQAIHLFLVPETRETSLIDKAARELRLLDPVKYAKVYGPGELKPKLEMRQIVTIWIRPFRMFVKEPIVFCLSLLSGFSDALIFLFIDSFHMVFGQWDFDIIQNGLTFVP